MSIFDDAELHLNTAVREAGFALGSLDMAKRDDITTLNGYTGAVVAKSIREAVKLLEKSKQLLETLNKKKVVA